MTEPEAEIERDDAKRGYGVAQERILILLHKPRATDAADHAPEERRGDASSRAHPSAVDRQLHEVDYRADDQRHADAHQPARGKGELVRHPLRREVAANGKPVLNSHPEHVERRRFVGSWGNGEWGTGNGWRRSWS